MPITDQQYTDWLNSDDAIRCILVETSAYNTTSSLEDSFYFSTVPFKSAATDTPANQVYTAIIKSNSVSVVESVEIPPRGSEGNTAIGTVQLDNRDHAIDSYLEHVWTGRTIVAYVGDIRWERADFRLIFSGIVEDIGAIGADTIGLSVQDKMARLRYPVTDAVLGGVTSNKDELIPLSFGEVHNVTPLLIDPAALKFKVHNGQIEDVIEVRDNGVPVTITKDLANGEFTLSASPSPSSTITASVQGDKSVTWRTLPGELIQRIVTDYGDINQRFVVADIDTTNFTDFDVSNPYPVGVYIEGNDDVLEVCNQIAHSVNAQMIIGRDGKLRLVRIDPSRFSTLEDITEADIVEGTLEVSEKVKTLPVIKLGYAKNWTVQQELETGIPAEHKNLYSREFLTVVVEDAAIKAIYKEDTAPDTQETLLLTQANASAVATNMLDAYKQIRKVYEFTGHRRLTELQIGDGVTLTHKRFPDLRNTLMVVGLSTQWDTGLVRVKLWG